MSAFPRIAKHYGPAIQGCRAIVSFMTVAELSYGMLNRGWRPRRRDQLLPYLRAHYIRYDADETLCDACAEVAWDAQRQGRGDPDC